MDEYVWGEASVSYPDWKGTFQLDHRMTGKTWYDLTGIDRKQWLIIGFDWGQGESGTQPLAAIVVPVGADLDSDLRATYVQLNDVDPWELVKAMTHIAEFRMRIRRVSGRQITIIDLADVPPLDTF